MKPFHASMFAAIVRTLETVRKLQDTSDNIPEDEKIFARSALAPLVDECIGLGLTTSVMSLEKFIDEYSKDNCQWRKIHALAIELQDRLIDEMRGRFFFSLSVDEVEHYARWREGWEEVLAPDSRMLPAPTKLICSPGAVIVPP
jgi:hypothetical protein